MSLITLVNITLAALFGGAIGFERQWNQGMAGLRTNALVAFGSACFVTIGSHLGSDRIAAQLVSGIGFLGAGVILHEGPSVRGLNTAATLWCAAATGALAGMGMRVEGAYAAIGVVALNIGLHRLQVVVNQRGSHPHEVEAVYVVEIACGVPDKDSVCQHLSHNSAAAGLELRGLRQETVGPGDGSESRVRIAAELGAHSRLDAAIMGLVREIGLLPGVTSAHWSIGSAAPAPSSGGMRR